MLDLVVDDVVSEDNDRSDPGGAIRPSKPTPTTLVEQLSTRLFTLVQTEAQFQVLEEQSRAKAVKQKTAEQQYFEQASQALSCTALTKTVDIEYLEPVPENKNETRVTTGTALRQRQGWFQVNLVDDRQFRVRKSDLFNSKIYRIKRKELTVSGKDKLVMSRRKKRESKKVEEAKKRA